MAGPSIQLLGKKTRRMPSGLRNISLYILYDDGIRGILAWNPKQLCLFKGMFGDFQPFPHVEIWFIIQLKQSSKNGWR